MKKFFKIILIILLSAIVIIAIALLVFTLSNRMFIGGTDETHTSYLNSNKIVIHADNPLGNSKSTVFNHSVYTSKIVLLGETHGYAEVQDIDKALLFHFNKTKGTRYYVAEIDSLTADKLNLFLKKPEKDTLLLKDVVANVKRRIIQQAGRELFNKWSDVYDYNRTLPDSLRISVIGLDKSVGDTLKIPRDSVMAMRLAALMEQPGMENETFYGLFGMFHVFQEGVTPNNVLSLAARLKDRNISVKSIVCMQVDSEVYMPKEAEIGRAHV